MQHREPTAPGDIIAPARGRPRSETARDAVLHAADDLLVELGYDALTMKSIAERAGVGRQTVYRWWSTKADILFEACTLDARRELTPVLAASPSGSRDDPLGDALDQFVERLYVFLSDSDAGATYLALVGAAQVDPTVAAQLRAADPVRENARALVDRLGRSNADLAIAQLVGPLVYQALSAPGPISRSLADQHRSALRQLWGL